MKKAACAVCGIGRIGFSLENDRFREKPASHAGAVMAHPAVKLTAVCDPDPEACKKFKKKYHNVPVYSSLTDLLESHRIDILHIASPHETHLDLLKQALQQNLSVIVLEKPVSDSYQKALKLYRYFESVKPGFSSRIVVNHERRFANDYRHVKKIIQEKRYGPLLSLRGVLYMGQTRTIKDIILDDGTHLFDIVRFLTDGDISIENTSGNPFEGGGHFCAEGTSAGIPVMFDISGGRDHIVFSLELVFKSGRINVGNGIYEEWESSVSPYYENARSLKKQKHKGFKKTRYFYNMIDHAAALWTGKKEQSKSSFEDGIKALKTVEDIVICALRQKGAAVSKVTDISGLLNTRKPLKILLDEILYSAKDVLDVENASVLMLNESKREFTFEAFTDKSQKLQTLKFSSDKGIAGRVLKTGQGEIVNETREDSDFFTEIDTSLNNITRNLLAVPMRIDNQVIGVLEVINSKNKSFFDDNDLNLIQAFADKVSIAVYSRSLIDDLERMNRFVNNRYNEMKAMYEITTKLKSEDGRGKIFQTIKSILESIFDLEKFSIMFFNPQKNTLEIVCHKGIKDFESISKEIHSNEGLAGQVFTTGEAYLESPDQDKGDQKRFFKKENSRYETRSFIIVPIHGENKKLGVMNLTAKKDKASFTGDELLSFRSIANQIGRSIESVFYYDQFQAKKKLDDEVQLTRSLQTSVLPLSFKKNQFIDIAAANIPAKNVCGDFYDFVELDPDRYLFFIADVSGKGLPAGLFMALSRSIILTELSHKKDILQTLAAANKAIYKDSKSGMFVTLFMILFDFKQKKVFYSSAGHDRQIFYKDREDCINELKTKGPPLGVMSDSRFEIKTAPFEKDDVIVLYTDGITEAVDLKNNEFGMTRFKEEIIKNKIHTAEGIKGAILNAAETHCGYAPRHDDMTMMVFKCLK